MSMLNKLQAVFQYLKTEGVTDVDAAAAVDLLQPFVRYGEAGRWDFEPPNRLSEARIKGALNRVHRVIPASASLDYGLNLACGARFHSQTVNWIYPEFEKPAAITITGNRQMKLLTVLETNVLKDLSRAFDRTLAGTALVDTFPVGQGDFWDEAGGQMYAACNTAVFWAFYALIGGGTVEFHRRTKMLSLMAHHLPYGRDNGNPGTIYVLSA